jgi:hypothetical protein
MAGTGWQAWYNCLKLRRDRVSPPRSMPGMDSAMPTGADDTLLPFALPSVGQTTITAAFDARYIGSNGGARLQADARP